MHIEESTFTISKAEARALVAFASTDITRQHINSISFDPSKGEACATDGHTLVRVKGECRDSETNGPAFLVDRDTLERAYKLAKKDTPITVNGAVSVGSTVLQYSDRTAAHFPPYEQVIPKYSDDRKIAPAFGINVAYLNRLTLVSKACEQSMPNVTCQTADALDPILFTCEGKETCSDWTIVVMPVRI